MTIKKRSKSRKSHKSVAKPTAQAKTESVERTETVVAKMVFDGDVFETEQDVRDYLEKAEWDVESDISVEENEEGDWVARPEGTDDADYERVSKVELEEEGVEAFVGELLVKEDDDDDDDDASDDDDDDDEPEQIDASADDDDDASDDDKAKAKKAAPKRKPVAKANGDDKKSGDGGKPKTVSKRAEFLSKRADERTKEKKFDGWDARVSDGNTLGETIKAGMSWDGVPPGYYDVASAFNSTVANIVKGENTDKQDMLNKAAADYAEIIGALDSYFDAYIEGGETMIAKAVDGDEAVKALEDWAKGYADFANSDGQPPVNQQTVAKSVEPAPAVTIDYTKMGEEFSSVISKALGPVGDALEELSDTVGAIASRSPTKKAADTTDGSAAKPRKIGKKDTADEDDEEYQKFSKSLFG
jgi:hypothetical protein